MPENQEIQAPPFDGDMKKSKEVESWLLCMKIFFRIHDYSKIMKAKIATYILKGKSYIWWEDMKNFSGIFEKELTWNEFEKLFRDQYFFEHYCDGKAKDFYELKMGQIIDDEYVTKFLEILRYVPYRKEEKAKVQRFINGFPMTFKDKIELLEPQKMKDAIKKLKDCYEQ